MCGLEGKQEEDGPTQKDTSMQQTGVCLVYLPFLFFLLLFGGAGLFTGKPTRNEAFAVKAPEKVGPKRRSPWIKVPVEAFLRRPPAFENELCHVLGVKEGPKLS